MHTLIGNSKMNETTLAADLSDSVARVALVDGAGQVVARAESPRGTATDPDALREAARRLVADVKSPITAAGVALPGAFDALPAEAAAVLREVTSSDIAIVPIAAGEAFAIAEEWVGAARGLKHVVSLAVSEHVIAGVLIDGKPWRGAHGMAASVGWLAVNPVEREDYRRLGAMQAEVSCSGIVRRFIWRIKSGDESQVAKGVKGDFSRITAEAILQGSRTGDGVSISIVRDTAKYVGIAVANLATIFDPEIIVLGGILTQAKDVLLEPIKLECSRRLHPQQSSSMRIVLSALGPDAVAIGAARAAARVGA
jgi:glucokinase